MDIVILQSIYFHCNYYYYIDASLLLNSMPVLHQVSKHFKCYNSNIQEYIILLKYENWIIKYLKVPKKSNVMYVVSLKD